MALLSSAALIAAATGCGKEDFQRTPKPPVPLQLSGVVTNERVDVSPDRFGAGPVVLIVSNQSKRPLDSVELEGQGIRERVGPVQVGDTATLQKTLAQGTYTVKVGSERALPREIQEARLTVGRRRSSSEDFLTYP